MTIAKMIEVLTALTSTGAVDKETDIKVTVPSDDIRIEDTFEVYGVSIFNNGCIELKACDVVGE